jgi:maltose phosphorylase
MRIKNETLSFNPRIPKQWNAYSFKVNFRNQILTVNVSQDKTTFTLEGDGELNILVNGENTLLEPDHKIVL